MTFFVFSDIIKRRYLFYSVYQMVVDKTDEVTTQEPEASMDKNNENANVSPEAKKYTDQATAETKEKVDTLQRATIDQKLSGAETKMDINAARTEFMHNLELERLDKYNWYLRACDILLNQINDAIDTAKDTKGLSQAWKRTMKITRDKLQKYKDYVENKINKLKKHPNTGIHADDIQTLREYRSNFESAKQDIARWQRWKLSDDAWYTYSSIEDARKSNIAQERMLQFEQKLEQETKDWAILNIFNKQEQTARNFYRRIAEWQYTSADYTIYMNNSSILDQSFQRCWMKSPTEQWVTSPSTWTRTWKYIDYSNTDWGEAFKQWGIAWIIDKWLSCCNNLTPWQRETRKSLWVLAWFWAWIYWLYKFFTSKKSFWSKVGITAAAFLWSEVITWENPISLFSKFMTWGLSSDKIKNSFWNAISWVWGSGIEASETIAPAMFSLMVFDQWTTIWNINEMTQSFKTDNKARNSFYQQSINKLTEQWWAQCAEYFRATFSDGFDEQKRNNRLASFWVTDISNPSNSGTLIYELANNATMNEVILEKFKSENGLKETNDKTKKQEFRQYKNSLKASNQVLSIAILQQHKDDWFDVNDDATYSERQEDKDNREELVNRVNNLSIDESKKGELKTAIQEFYNKRTIETKPRLSDFSLEIQDWLLVITSHDWEKSQIDLERKELVWFWNEIRFTDLSDLINIADITNSILCSQRWKIPVWYPPFQYKLERKAICFNDAKTISKDFDTRVLSTWRWAKIKKTNQVYTHLEEYAQYLSNHWLENNKVEINPTLYPNVKKLSDTWIIFTDENEVKELETRLKKIKDELSDYYATPAGSPFKISWQLKNIDKKIVFVAIDWEKMILSEKVSDKFPTILANKEKFLNFMNDTKNWMYNPWI